MVAGARCLSGYATNVVRDGGGPSIVKALLGDVMRRLCKHFAPETKTISQKRVSYANVSVKMAIRGDLPLENAILSALWLQWAAR